MRTFSQEGFVDGYVITLKGDTVHGKIKDRKPISNPISRQKIIFRDSVNRESKFSGEGIKEYYRKASNQRYRSLPMGIEVKMKFLEVVFNGPVILFASKQTANSVTEKIAPDGTIILVSLKLNEKANQVIVKKNENSRIGMPIEVTYFLQKNKDPNSLMKWRPADYKVAAQYFFSKDTSLLKKITDDSVHFEDIEKIVQEYNNFTGK